jgi:hypothetical protein
MFAICDDMTSKKSYFHHPDQLTIGLKSAEFLRIIVRENVIRKKPLTKHHPDQLTIGFKSAEFDFNPRKCHKKKVIDKKVKEIESFPAVIHL